MDKGYDYNVVRALAQEYGFTLRLRQRGESANSLESGKKARRWVVERTLKVDEPPVRQVVRHVTPLAPVWVM